MKKTKEQKYHEAVNEANEFVSEGLEHLKSLLDEARETGWSYDLDFDQRDIANAFFVFVDIISNSAIKKGFITEENAEQTMTTFIADTYKAFGVDISKIANKVYSEYESN